MKPRGWRLSQSYLISLGTASPATRELYRRAIGEFLAAGGGRLNTWAVERYLEALNARPLSNYSRATYISAVRSFLKFCIGQGAMTTSPRNLLERPRFKQEFVNHLTSAEYRALLAATEGMARLAVLLMGRLGLRVSELTHLQWRHFYKDERGRVGVHFSGKGSKERMIAVMPDVLRAVRLVRDQAGRGTRFSGQDERCVLHKPNGEPYTRQSVYNFIRAGAQRAGIPKLIGPHALRHTHATAAAAAGVDPYSLQQQLGHANLNTTMRYVNITHKLDNPTSRLVGKALR